MTDYRQLLPKGIKLKRVFEDVLPKIHAERKHEYADFVSGVDIVVAVRLTDAGRIWTVTFNGKRIEIEADEGLDFPVVTIEGTEAQWEQIREDLIAILEHADARRHLLKGRPKFDQKLRQQLERYDGVIDVEIPGDSGIAKFRLILNNYESQKGFRKFKVTIPRDLIFSVAKGDVDIETAARGLAIQGEMSLAVDLGGTFLKHYQP